MSRDREDFEEFAGILSALQALIVAGVSERTSWAVLSESSKDPIVAELAGLAPMETISRGLIRVLAPADLTVRKFSQRPVTPTRRRAWAEVAAFWAVVDEAGTPIGSTLAALAANAREHADVRRRVALALAAATLTGRVLTFLPVFGAVLVSLMGFDLLGSAFRSPLVGGSVIVAIVLMAVSQRWRRSLAARARVPEDDGALWLRLVAAGLSGGLPIPQACELAGRALLAVEDLEEAAVPRISGPPRSAVDAVARMTRIASTSGAPIGGLIRADADRLQRQRHAEALKKAMALETTQLIPLGVCDLPAFLLLSVVPVLGTLLAGWAG